MEQPCAICRRHSPHAAKSGPIDLHWLVSCDRCGQYEITGSFYAVLGHNPLTQRQMANASGWIRANSGVLLTEYDHATVTSLRTPTVGEKAEKLMRHIAKMFPEIATRFGFHFDIRQQVAIWAATEQEVEYIVDYLLRLDYLEGNSTQNQLSARITPRGWEYLDTLDRGGADTPFGFVAMPFNENTNPLREEGIKPAIIDSGYDARLIDEIHHLNHIDDEIIAAIRRSRFLVADLTGQRQNVYYEAGFAQGMGTKVIWACREDEVRANEPHLDVRQYAFITWTPGRISDFRKLLTARIVRTVGQGPIRPPSLPGTPPAAT